LVKNRLGQEPPWYANEIQIRLGGSGPREGLKQVARKALGRWLARAAEATLGAPAKPQQALPRDADYR